jgi:hypothetical protein
MALHMHPTTLTSVNSGFQLCIIVEMPLVCRGMAVNSIVVANWNIAECDIQDSHDVIIRCSASQQAKEYSMDDRKPQPPICFSRIMVGGLPL